MSDTPRAPVVQADVIILSWNRVDDTIAAITSAAEQIGVEKRILVVDQGSDPSNLARLESYLADVPEARLKKLGANAGVAGGRNIASAMGHAPYIIALDSDAVFADPHALARAVAYLDAHPALCAIGFRIDNYFTGDTDWTSWDYPGAHSPHQGFATTRFIGAGHAIRRKTFESVGGYDERLFFCGEELDLCYRMLNTGERIEYVPTVAIRHKVSPEHRVYWGKGRFFFTVRNNLYTAYKFGASPWRLGLSGAAFLAKGFRNGFPGEAVRAFSHARKMARAFRVSRDDKRPYQLSRETWRYILHCEPTRRDGIYTKIVRQFSRLPHQA